MFHSDHLPCKLVLHKNRFKGQGCPTMKFSSHLLKEIRLYEHSGAKKIEVQGIKEEASLLSFWSLSVSHLASVIWNSVERETKKRKGCYYQKYD